MGGGPVAPNNNKKVKHVIGAEQEFSVNKIGVGYW